MSDSSQQVLCSCSTLWQYKLSLRQTIQMSKWVVIVKCICHVSVNHLVQRVTLVLRGKLTPLFCSFKLFSSFLHNWHISWLVRRSGASHMLVLAPWHMLKPTCQWRQWCCHCRHQADMCWLVWQSQGFCGSTQGNWMCGGRGKEDASIQR